MKFRKYENKLIDVAETLKVMSSPHRLMVLCCLCERPHHVGEMADVTGLRMPTLSQHLAVLKAQGLVTVEREGTKMLYRLADPQIEALIDALANIYCRE